MMHLTYPGPDLNVSYHNHSRWSDGSAPLEEVCRKGKASGLKELGISDHWVDIPFEELRPVDWSTNLSKLDEYIETLQTLKAELEDETFSLKIGLEVDFFFENADSALARLKKYPLDYMIGSVHYAGIFPVDHSIDKWLPLSEDRKAEICEIYWKKLEGAAARPEFTWLGHLDLPKKFGLIDNAAYFSHAVRVLDIVRESGMGIELNTAGWFKECREQYPSLEILREANARRIPVVVNADAHAPEHLKRNFEEAGKVLEEAGYPPRGKNRDSVTH